MIVEIAITDCDSAYREWHAGQMVASLVAWRNLPLVMLLACNCSVAGSHRLLTVRLLIRNVNLLTLNMINLFGTKQHSKQETTEIAQRFNNTSWKV